MEAKVHRWVQRRGWDKAAEHYESQWREQLRPAHNAVLDAAQLRPGDSVLDIACGTGMVTLPAAHIVGPQGTVMATDLAQSMVDDTARRAADAGLTNVDVARGGAEDLGDLDVGFDVALCSLGLMYVPSPTTAVAEIARVVRAGGRTVLAVWGERQNCGWAEIFPIVDARVDSDVCPMFFALGAPSALAGLLRDSSFDDIDEQRLQCDLAYDDEASALAAAFLGGPVALAYARFDDETKASAHAHYLASIDRYRSGSGYRIPGEFVIVSARTPTGPSDLTGSMNRSSAITNEQKEQEPMSITETPVDNGVNSAALLEAREQLTAAPEAAEFQWRTTCEWINGTHNRSTVETFSGLGQEHAHVTRFTFDADHPEIFASEDNGATPAEIALAALGSCLTSGLAAVAQHREIQLRKVTATVEGDMNLLGILGADPDVRNGYREVRVNFDIDADASQADIEALVAQSQKRSAVFDLMSNPTDIAVRVG